MEKTSETLRLITSRPELLVPLTVVLVLVALTFIRRRRFNAQKDAAPPGRRRPFRPTSNNPGKPDTAAALSGYRAEAGHLADDEDDTETAATRRKMLIKARIQIIMALLSILGLTIIGIVNTL